MGITAATASWLVPSLIAAAGTGVSAIQANQQAKQQEGQANEAKRTAQAQAQANAEKAPELSTQAGVSDAVKKRRTQYGIENSIIAANNTGSQAAGNQYWG